MLVGMEIVLISSALVLQERKQNLRRKFRRVKLFRKEGGKEKEDEAAKKEAKKENSERDDGEKERKRRGSTLRPVLDEYKVLAKARPKKPKLVPIEHQTKSCDHDGKCEGPSRLTSSNPIFLKELNYIS